VPPVKRANRAPLVRPDIRARQAKRAIKEAKEEQDPPVKKVIG